MKIRTSLLISVLLVSGCADTEDPPSDIVICIPEDNPTVNVQVVDREGAVVLNPAVEFRMGDSVETWTACRPGYAGGTVDQAPVPDEWCHCGQGVGRIELRVSSSETDYYLEVENNETTAQGCQVATRDVVFSLD